MIEWFVRKGFFRNANHAGYIWRPVYFKHFKIMTIIEIYHKYKIPPKLQEHQLRVAGVAKMIADNILDPSILILDRDSVVVACLLHDMGNIIKFDLNVFPEFLQPEGRGYWQAVQDEFVAKYGKDEHYASMEIAKEIGVGEYILELIDCIGFVTGPQNIASNDYNRKICAYSDIRVTPHGVTSLEARLSDLRERYAKRFPGEREERLRLEYENSARELEKQIFEVCSIGPGDIMEESAQAEVKGFKDFSV